MCNAKYTKICTWDGEHVPIYDNSINGTLTGLETKRSGIVHTSFHD